MEDNVALDSAKQKQFVKSVRGIKKLLKKKGTVPKKVAPKPKKDGIKKDGVKKRRIVRKRKERGLVYLSHIPHGFYEHEMTEYFKQFGVVTNARVIRSKRTGNSKGYAFVEFKEPTVAEIVADTMNNYLMGKRLIKAVYVPPSKQRRHALRKNWNYQNNPLSQLRLKLKKQHNADKSDEEELKHAKIMLSNLNKTKKKLSEIGIDYDFFKPVDVPMELAEEIEKRSNKGNDNIDVKPKSEIKNESDIKPKGAKKEVKSEPDVKEKKNKKGKENKKDKPAVAKMPQDVEENKKSPVKNKKNVEGTKKQQKEKQAKLDKAGVKALEDFIEINGDSNDESDSSVDFDSDEYEKMIENEDSLSEEESDFKIDEGKEKVKTINKKINKRTRLSTPKVQDKLLNKMDKSQNKKPNQNVQQPKKRKPISISESTPSAKNAKFEKQNNKKALNKVTKKKK